MVDKWTWSDKLAIALACIGGAMAIVLFWIEKTPLAAGLSVGCIAALMVYPVIHFAPSWKARVPALVVMLALVGIFGWKIWPKEVAIAAKPSVPISNNQKPISAPISTLKREKYIAPKTKGDSRPIGSVQGTDNTVVGHVPYTSIKGNGNTIVGATDANGNTILNHGGTAIGNGATACPTCTSIGAHSGEHLSAIPKAEPPSTKPPQ